MGASIWLTTFLTAFACLAPAGARSFNPTSMLLVAPPYLQDQPGCAQLIQSYTQTGQGMSELMNPVLASPEQVDALLQVCDQLHSCLQNINSELSQSQRQADLLCQYYSLFASGDRTPDSVTRLTPVELGTSNDPAVLKLRNQALLPAPPGYIFVQIYPSRQAMPDIIRPAFQDPQVAGVTILSRYVALLEEKKSTWPERLLQSTTQEKTLSHELVHAFVNSYLAEKGQLGLVTLPKWFEEGVAIYFSGSNQPSAVITPNLTVSQAPTEEYQQYAIIFQYLQAKLGRQELINRIRQVLDSGDATHLYRDLGIQDDRTLVSAAQSWQAGRIQMRSILVLAVVLLTSYWLYSRLPELECPCGFRGRLSDFSHDRCPQCGRPVQATNRKPGRSQLQIAPTCQVCQRRFWPWQRAHLSRHPGWIKVWTANPAGSNAPLPRYVDRLCDQCAARSATLYEAYRADMMLRISQAREATSQAYRAWLEAAPMVWFPTAPGWQVLTFQEALDWIVEAALQPAFQDWLEPTSGLKLASPPPLGEAGFVPPPDGYQSVLLHIDNIRGFQSKQVGSIFRTPVDRVALLWQVKA